MPAGYTTVSPQCSRGLAEESSTHHARRLPHPDAHATAAAHLFKTLALSGQASHTQCLAMVIVEESFAGPHEILEILAIFWPKSRARALVAIGLNPPLSPTIPLFNSLFTF
jgi:hypothetical protein